MQQTYKLMDLAENPTTYMKLCRMYHTAETEEDLMMISQPHLVSAEVSNHDVALALAAVKQDKGWINNDGLWK